MDMYCNCECTRIFYRLENNEIGEKKVQKTIGKSKYYIEKFCMYLQTILKNITVVGIGYTNWQIYFIFCFRTLQN